MPGRSLNLGAGGVAAVLAAELLPGEVVGVEILLPRAPVPLRARARVRHHDKLQCGMEFVGLSAEQKAAIRRWTEQTKAELYAGVREQLAAEAEKSSTGGRWSGPLPPARLRRRSGWVFFMVLAAILLAVSFWRWNRGWEDLESGLRKNQTNVQPQANVSADVMEKLVTHRVDPDYPAAARPANLRGVIVLDVVVGRDGSVVKVKALNGPEVLGQAAVDALRWWRFEPYRVEGKPVVVETTVAVEFRP